MSELTKFIFEGLPVRGMLVRLTGAWQEVLQRRKRWASIRPKCAACWAR
jgi:molecular chaperone Hsp33